MAQVFGKDLAGVRYSKLFRVINCLDCDYPNEEEKLNRKLVTMYYSASALNKEIRHCIKMLEKKRSPTMDEIAIELQYVFGKHVITNQRDDTYRVN